MRPSDYRRISLAAMKSKSTVLDSEEKKISDRAVGKNDINQQRGELIRSKSGKEIPLSQKQSDIRKSDSMSFRSQRSIHSANIVIKNEEVDETPIEPVKKDLLDYLNKLTASVEWYFLFFQLKINCNIKISLYLLNYILEFSRNFSSIQFPFFLIVLIFFFIPFLYS